jgi:hypothetical protein
MAAVSWPAWRACLDDAATIKRMLRSQRILVTIGFVLLAWLLHTNLCEWVYKEQLPYGSSGGVATYWHSILWARTHKLPPAAMPTPGHSRNSYTGIVTDFGVNPGDAVVFGIALPLTLLMLVAYSWLGWRRDARAARGLCPVCGYDLRGASEPSAACPECGSKSA